MQTLLNLLAGVSLLVWGTHIVRTGILRLFGSSLRRFLRISAAKPLHAFFAGAGITALIQSSTATALIVASFAGQGLIGTAQALAVMLGADVGTSLVTVILSFDLSWLSPLLIFVGVVLFLTRQADSIGRFGRVLIGLGLIMFALQWISVAAKPVVQARGVQVIFASLTGDGLLDLLVAALITILCYSSLAVVLLVAALASLHVIALPVALGLVLGANLGSGLLGMLSTLNSPPEARRVTLGNFLFKLIGCTLLAAAPFPDGGPDRGARPRARSGGRAVPPGLQRRAGPGLHLLHGPDRARRRTPAAREGAAATTPRNPGTSIRPPSRRRRSPSRARRARRCASATSSSRCCKGC